MRASLAALLLLALTVAATAYALQPLLAPKYKVIVYVVGDVPSERAAVYTVVARHGMIGAILVKRYVDGVSSYVIPLDRMRAVPGGSGPIILAGCVSYELEAADGPLYCGACNITLPEQVKGYRLSATPTIEELRSLLSGIILTVDAANAECYAPGAAKG